MSSPAVYGFADSAAAAEDIVARLRTNGFASEAISVLVPAPDAAGEDDGGTMAPQGAVAGVGTGGVIGGALGWLSGVGALLIPGVGPFLAAGPLFVALTGAAMGATVGGVAGALVGLGLSGPDTQRYESHLRAGRVLISVHATADRAAAAERILRAAGADDVSRSRSPDASGDLL